MNSVRALGFVSTMSIMLLNLVQLPLYILQRPIFYKHRAQRFFRTSSYIVAHSIVNLPQTLIEVLFSMTFPYWNNHSCQITQTCSNSCRHWHILCLFSSRAVNGRKWGTILWVSNSLILSSILWLISILLYQCYLFNSRNWECFSRYFCFFDKTSPNLPWWLPQIIVRTLMEMKELQMSRILQNRRWFSLSTSTPKYLDFESLKLNTNGRTWCPTSCACSNHKFLHQLYE